MFAPLASRLPSWSAMHDVCVTCAKKCAVAMGANVLKTQNKWSAFAALFGGDLSDESLSEALRKVEEEKNTIKSWEKYLARDKSLIDNIKSFQVNGFLLNAYLAASHNYLQNSLKKRRSRENVCHSLLTEILAYFNNHIDRRFVWNGCPVVSCFVCLWNGSRVNELTTL